MKNSQEDDTIEKVYTKVYVQEQQQDHQETPRNVKPNMFSFFYNKLFY